jgi:hypothetical protein
VGSPPATGLLVDVLGFLTGTVLYGMLLVMVWRERLRDGAPLLSMRGRLTLLTGVFGLVWNLGALFSFGTRVVTPGAAHPIVEALAFAALGFLPAAVVHAIAGGQAVMGRSAARAAIGTSYLLSTIAAILHGVAAFDAAPVPSRAALWLLTGGFSAMAIWLFAVTRRQPAARRGIWFAALAIFAVSALHFRSHAGNEAWWVELAGHHASLPLALAILHQDYRFALADLFLEKAIALLCSWACRSRCCRRSSRRCCAGTTRAACTTRAPSRSSWPRGWRRPCSFRGSSGCRTRSSIASC